MSKLVALLSDPTTKGSIIKVPSNQATLNGQPIATGGSKLLYKGRPTDAPLDFATGILLNNQPLTFVTAKTVKGATIQSGGGTTAEIVNGHTSQPGAPKLKAEDMPSETVGLTTTYAMEQVQQLATELAFPMFYQLFNAFFDTDIPMGAYEKLYRAMSAKEVLNPPVVVYAGNGQEAFWHKGNPDGKKTAAPHIGVYEGLVRRACGLGVSPAEAQEAAALLMAQLLEEYGHYLDHLLRNQYSKVGKDARYDEGVVFNYFVSNYQITEHSGLDFATATVQEKEYLLRIDLSALLAEVQKTLARYEADYQTNQKEFFKAGKLDALMGKYGHYDIEEVLREKGILSDEQLSRVYLGNYMRDISQVITPATTQFTRAEQQELKGFHPDIEGLAYFNSIKPTRATWTLVAEILAAHHTAKEARPEVSEGVKDLYSSLEEPPSDTMDGFKEIAAKLGLKTVQLALDYITFVKNYGHITQKKLGVYRPEEHIDSPIFAAVYDALGMDTGLVTPGKYFCPPQECQSPPVNTYHGMKNHIRYSEETATDAKPYRSFDDCTDKETSRTPGEKREGYYAPGLPTAASYMKKELMAGVQLYNEYKHRTDDAGELNRNEALRRIGQGLHVLEDYFAHTNFAELALIKHGISVYPWVDLRCKELKDFYTTPYEPKNKPPRNREKLKRHPTVEPFYNTREELFNQLYRTGHLVVLDHFRFNGFYFRYKAKDAPKEDQGLIYSVEEKNGLQEVQVADQGLEYRGRMYAAQIPLVSGYFSGGDTLHSLIDVVSGMLKKKDINLLTVAMSNNGVNTLVDASLDLADMLIIALLADLKLQQQEPDKNQQDTGLNYSELLEYYARFIEIRQIVIGVLNHVKKAELGVVTWLVSRLLNTLYANIYNCMVTLVTDTLKSINHVMIDIQNTALIRELGTNPSHSQLAKDEADHPLHTLAAKLAKEAVLGVGKELDRMIDIKKMTTPEAVCATALHYMQHPAKSQWADGAVQEWVRFNAKAIEDLHEDEQRRQIMAKLGETVIISIELLKESVEKANTLLWESKKFIDENCLKLEHELGALLGSAHNLSRKTLKKIQDMINSLENYYEELKAKKFQFIDYESYYQKLLNKIEQKTRELLETLDFTEDKKQNLEKELRQFYEQKLQEEQREMEQKNTFHYKLREYCLKETQFNDYKKDGRRLACTDAFLWARLELDKTYIGVLPTQQLAALNKDTLQPKNKTYA